MDFWTFWFDLIWHIFDYVIWFDAFLNNVILFDLTTLFHDLIWICEIIIDPFGYWFKSWIQAKPMAPMERARWELSIGATFVHETFILSSLWLEFGYTLNSDLKSESNHDLIWFAPEFSPQIMIWFDLTTLKNSMIWFEVKSFLCRFDLIWICPPLH